MTIYTASVDNVGDTVYLSFWDPPEGNFLDRLRLSGLRYIGKAKWWTANVDVWPKIKAKLEVDGVGFVEERFATTFDRPHQRPQSEEAKYVTAAAVACQSSFAAWCEANLKIKHRETGRYVPFRLNPVQRRLGDLLNQQYREKGLVRAIVLKARQEGISSYVQAVLYKMVLETPGIEAIVMAHDDPGTDAIFRRTKIFRDECPVKLPEKYSNRKEIEFEAPHRSAIRVNVAGTRGFGRGDTRQAAHLSELAWWPEATASETLGSVLNSIHDTEGTFVVIESTANGVGGPFYDRWKQAEELYEQGASLFMPIFFSWMDDPEYKLSGIALDDKRWKNVPREWLEDEPMLRQLGATDEQLAWRRMRIGEKCGGSIDLFKQEYPSTPDEAFIATGRPVFPASITVPKHAERAKIEKETPAPRYSIDARGEWYLDPAGPIKVWEKPKPGQQYLISADVARGVAVEDEKSGGARLGDYSTAGVWDRKTNREIATWHGRLDPDLFASQLYALGRRYNFALIACEANHYGIITLKALLRMRYPNVFRKERHDKPTFAPIDQPSSANYMEHGWWTSPASKNVMIGDLNRMIRDHEIEIYDPDAWKELITYIRKADGTMEAQPGCYDDRVIRLAIAATLLTAHVIHPNAPKEELKEYTYEWFLKKAGDRERGQREGAAIT